MSATLTLTRRQKQILTTALSREANDRLPQSVPLNANQARPFDALQDAGLGMIRSDGLETVSIIPAQVREKRVFELTALGRAQALSLRS